MDHIKPDEQHQAEQQTATNHQVTDQITHQPINQSINDTTTKQPAVTAEPVVTTPQPIVHPAQSIDPVVPSPARDVTTEHPHQSANVNADAVNIAIDESPEQAQTIKPATAAQVSNALRGSPSIDAISDSTNKSPSEAGPEGEMELEKIPIQKLSLAGLAMRYRTTVHLENPRQSAGLSEKDAAERLIVDGLNQLTPPPETSEIVKFLSHFADPFMLLLMLCSGLAFMAYGIDTSQLPNLWIGIVLIGVVIISSTFGYIQSGKASAVMSSFKSMLPRTCHVVRDGRLQDMPASRLVVGDIVRVGTGDQCPADLRLIYCNDLKVEVSSLTGESLPISCTVTSKEEKVEEAKNIVFNSSQCLEGEALGVVIACGDNTLIGKIARLASHTETVDTTLQREVKGFVKKLTLFSFCMGVVFFIIGVARGQPVINAFINGFIVVMIANVPEGLPVSIVTILTITGKRLAALNVFVKQLSSVETLGSCTVIASDKTGTLTQNKMTVSRLWFDLTPMSVDTVYRDLGPSTLTMNPNTTHKAVYAGTATLRALERVAAVCSRTRFTDHRDLTDAEARQLEQSQLMRNLDPSMTLRSAKAAYPTFLATLDNNLTINTAKRAAFSGVLDDSKREVTGDASETALFNFIRARQSVELVRYHNRAVFEVPFNSRNKYALTIMKPYKIPGSTDQRRILLMKGAPEIILARCNRYLQRGKIEMIDEDFTAQFQAAYETFGGFGERVLGFAQLELDENEFPPEFDSKYSVKEENYPSNNLVFVGLISLIDPPKDSVPNAIAQCRSAGVRVTMVTGDHPLTAAAIARQVGIITTNTREELAHIRGVHVNDIPDDEVDAIVIRGSELDSWSQIDWDRALSKSEIVFARTTPSQKLQIVENFQRLGEVVACLGDGVNDSPALKKADIGVAMGREGSDVARDAADVILMDDDFASVVIGIREGRTIFDNISKTIAYTVTHMPPEVIPILLNLAFGVPLGLNAILILIIDVGTELAPAISLAYEKPELDVMNRPPRNAAVDHLVTMKTVTYWYLMAGAVETLTCFLAFFLVFNSYGVSPLHLSFVDNNWIGAPTESQNPTLYIDGREYDRDRQIYILAQAQTAYWICLTGSQVFHIFMCKTRVLSVFQHGLFDNHLMVMGVLLEIAIILIIAFIPPNDFFMNHNPPGYVWLIVLVGWVGLFLINEPRKWLIRNKKGNRFVDFLAW